jgi:hypothetical protein
MRARPKPRFAPVTAAVLPVISMPTTLLLTGEVMNAYAAHLFVRQSHHARWFAYYGSTLCRWTFLVMCWRWHGSMQA